MNKFMKNIARLLAPQLYMDIKEARIRKFKLEGMKSKYDKSKAQPRACHFHELFVNHEGKKWLGQRNLVSL